MRYIIDFFKFLSNIYYSCISGNRSFLASKLRQIYYHTNCYIDTLVYISKPSAFTSGKKTALYHNTYIQNDMGSVAIGENSHLGAYCFVNVRKVCLKIGNDVSIGPHTSIIMYSNHYEKGKKNTEARICKDIINCTILPGTIIDDNCVIGANSLVKDHLEANAIYAGTPVKKIKPI